MAAGPPCLKNYSLSTVTCSLSRGHSSAGRAPALQAGSHRFESGCLHQPTHRLNLIFENWKIGNEGNCNVTRGEVNLAKRIRAHDGCLGITRRRRTWQTAKSSGEPSTGCDPEVSEWGNPPCREAWHPGMNKDSPRGATPGEVKHLSTPRRGKQTRTRE